MHTLYIFVGPPGSGKTTVANYICRITGAVHIWADRERQAMFGNPSHNATESEQLYTYLNQKTKRLLAEGKDVVFDTNFNFYKDREHLRAIAAETGAQLRIIRMVTDSKLAKERATHGAHAERNGMDAAMTASTFQSILEHLEPLKSHEQAVDINGIGLTEQDVARILGLS